MKTLFLDVEVLLDVLLDRAPRADSAAALWAAVETRKARGLVTTQAVTAIHALLKSGRGGAFADRGVSDLLAVFNVARVSEAVFIAALSLRLTRFDDAVSAVSLLAIVLALAWHFGLHQQLLERLHPRGVARVKTDEKANVQIADIPVDKYVPPSVDSLHYFGHGLSTEQAEALQKCEEVFVLDFRYRPAEGFTVLREAQELALALARETGGLLWDEESREVFTPEAWKERRLDPWTGTLPHAPSQYAIHLYRSDELLRAITLGMGKFGLPDVVVEDLPASSSDSVGALVNLTCQTLVEKGRLDSPGHLRVSVPDVKSERLSKSLVASYQEKATGKAELALVLGTKEEGDPDNRLLEIDFPAAAGMSRLEAQNALLESLFGATDHLTRTRHDDELLEASRKAKEEFPRLAALARKGFAPGQRLLLKAPFKTDAGGNEWMWVEVVTWKGDLVNGILQNDPYEVSGLKAGARVEFRASEAFDFILYQPDGTQQGNGTGEILRRREGKPAPEVKKT